MVTLLTDDGFRPGFHGYDDVHYDDNGEMAIPKI